MDVTANMMIINATSTLMPWFAVPQQPNQHEQQTSCSNVCSRCTLPHDMGKVTTYEHAPASAKIGNTIPTKSGEPHPCYPTRQEERGKKRQEIKGGSCSCPSGSIMSPAPVPTLHTHTVPTVSKLQQPLPILDINPTRVVVVVVVRMGMGVGV